MHMYTDIYMYMSMYTMVSENITDVRLFHDLSNYFTSYSIVSGYVLCYRQVVARGRLADEAGNT